ncbi:DUF4255 domain-containing protein [Thermopolyspora sp. NPDC052614]|uniref:DUF4255 domain-containing protein n=1 Tax=Thermopolyspora sp. NPDC052614 TaxID=3155682 RepID=UPI00343B6A31
MAGYAGIAATSQAILGLLESAAAGEPGFASAAFSVYTSSDLQRPQADRLGVSLYLYHITVNTSRRNALGRTDEQGRRLPPPVPLDLHYLLTAWAKDASTQQRLLGWSVRVLQDTATLPAGVLNAHAPEPVFRPSETVELIWENLTRQDVFDIWEVARANQQPSAAYVARVVEIESTVRPAEPPPVQTRDLRFGVVPA